MCYHFVPILVSKKVSILSEIMGSILEEASDAPTTPPEYFKIFDYATVLCVFVPFCVAKRKFCAFMLIAL